MNHDISLGECIIRAYIILFIVLPNVLAKQCWIKVLKAKILPRMVVQPKKVNQCDTPH